MFNIAAGANLVVVLHIAANDAALIENILEPVDEFVAGTAQLAFLRERRRAGENQHRNTAFCARVVNRSAQRLRAALHVNQHGLGASCNLRVTMRGAQRYHFVGASDHSRNGGLPEPSARTSQSRDDRCQNSQKYK